MNHRAAGFSKLILLSYDKMCENCSSYLGCQIAHLMSSVSRTPVAMTLRDSCVLNAYGRKQTNLYPSCLFALLQPIDFG